jgi:hypothetical protein
MERNPIKKWGILKTEAADQIEKICTLAYNHSLMYAVILGTGGGKTTAYNLFRKNNPEHVFVIKVEKEWTAKILYRKMLEKVGVVDFVEPWIKTSTLSEKFADTILESDTKYLFIFDEAGKFSSNMLEYFQTIRDKTENSMGMILSGTSEFKRNLDKWDRKKIGAIPELVSRFTEIIEISDPSETERFAVAKHNGIHNPTVLGEIVKKSKNLRDVYNNVIAYRASQTIDLLEPVDEVVEESADTV